MGKIVKGLFGGGDGGVRAAQAKQQAAIEGQQASVRAIEEGQRRNRGGGAGLLAYIDDKLKSTFGG